VWAKQFGGSNNDQAHGVGVDSAGNVYTTGYFQNTADFDPGTGTFNLTSAGSGDSFISKLDAAGNFVWAKQFGGSSHDISHDMNVDSVGNVYTVGSFEGAVDFDPGIGSTNLNAVGLGDSFISKLDAAGNFVWAKQFGGSSHDYAVTITTDSAGNVYTIGNFQSTIDFDPSSSTFNLTSAGRGDVFISKLDAVGNFVWAKQFGDSNFDDGYSINVDSMGNVYTTGYFSGTADFNPGSGNELLTSAGSNDIFIAKLDADGNFVWAKRVGGSSDDVGNEVSVDGAGNLYFAGRFQDTVDFDPGAGTSNLMSAGGSDIFMAKLDADGNFIWAKRTGSVYDDSAHDLALDTAGNLYTVGYFQDIVDFDPGAGTTNLTSAGNRDSFITKFSPLTVSLAAIDTVAAETTPSTNFGLYQITRNSNSGVLAVKLVIDAGSTASAADYNLSVNVGSVSIIGSTVTITIPDGVASVNLMLTLNDDLQAEGAESLKLNLASDSAYKINTTANTGTVTIQANDTVVTNTSNSGEGSLRQAILNANAFAGKDTIAFQISSGAQTINLTSGLPTITDAVIIDGTTQTGFLGSPIIELNGANVGYETGLVITAGNSTIKGLVINRFMTGGILLKNRGGNIIQGNFIGTDVSGKVGLGNSGAPGVYIENISNNIIGGTTPEARNLISGNATGIAIHSNAAQENQILGNFIGTDITGTTVISSGVGVSIGFGANNNVIGGTTLQSRNLISGNSVGIRVVGK
jgi:hypothetical protein